MKSIYMKKFEIIETDEYPSFDLKITLKPTFKCNQQCWFCSEFDNDTTEWSQQDIYTVMSKLKSISNNYKNKKVFIYFYGGEPTLHSQWENMVYKLIDIFKESNLYIQTQTNLSLSYKRLIQFAKEVQNKPTELCVSYHFGKQKIEEFIKKLKILEKYNILGNIFVNTDYLNEEQFIKEFYELINNFPLKVKMRFTEISTYKEGYPLGDLLHFEYRYFSKKYPQMLNYLEQGFNFQIDDKVLNFADVLDQDINKQFRFMKCQCGSKNIVIDHNLKVYHCNDDFTNNINVFELDIDFEDFLKTDIFCLNKACYDGLEFTKYKT